jgi:formate hydrogenlyase subunit 3/multisubunit Na+/H+ antiporter MnhD subunit
MSAPILWIVFPGVLSLVLIFLRRRVVSVVVSVLSALLLAGMAWAFRIGEVISLGPWDFVIDEQLVVLGRSFIIDNGDRAQLILFFIAVAFWFFGTLAIDVPRLFVPLGLSMVAILSAALAVDPFIFAPLLIMMAILISILLLIPWGQQVSPGVLRYLVYQTLGMIATLLAGWFLIQVVPETGNLAGMVRAAVFLGFGFVCLLGVFPLHSWIPMLAKETPPYVAAFVFSALLSVGIMLGLDFLNQFLWLEETLDVLDILRFLGVVTIVAGGMWAAFQRDLGSMLGYAVVVEVGRTLMVIGLPSGQGLSYTLLLPRILSSGVWALALTVLRPYVKDFRFRTVQGMARRFPIVAAGVIFAHFSLAGLPLLAGFPVYLTLWEQLSIQESFTAFWAVLGSVGLMMGGLRSLAVLVMGPEDLPWSQEEGANLFAQILIVLGVGMLFVVGLFPQWFFPLLRSLAFDPMI